MFWWLVTQSIKSANDTVVSTNKRSQAEVFTVYLSLKYLECNNYNVHFALDPLA